MRAPSPVPTSRSFRYSPAHVTRPGSTARSNVTIIFDTLPVEVMITTTTTCGCSASTSICLMLAVLRSGADTTASRLVTCDRASVMVRTASSTSLRISESSSRGGAAAPAADLDRKRASDRPRTAARRPSAPCPPRRAGGRADRAPPAAPARCEPSRRGSRARAPLRSTSTPPAGQCAGSPPPPCTESSPAVLSGFAWP